METTEATKKAARTAIRKIAGTYNKDIVDILFATVKAGSVDKAKRTCTVIPVSGRASTEIESVSLSIDQNDGDIKIPKDGSTVGVAISTEIDPFIFAWSDIEEIILKGGQFGGLTKTQELQTQLDKSNSLLTAIINIINGSPIPEPGSGSPSAFQAALQAAIATEELGDFSDIENTTITHGNS